MPSRFSQLPVAQLSRTRTRSPAAVSAATMFEPMKPAPPVTRYLAMWCPLGCREPLLLLEESVERSPGLCDLGGAVLGRPVLEGEERAEVRSLPVGDVLGDVLLALVVSRGLPVLAV